MVRITHVEGEIVLTPDHVIFADDRFVPAREVAVGSVLSSGSVVSAVAPSLHAVINPLTVNSRILAAGLEGMPIIASTTPEWLAEFMLATTYYPLPYSLT